MDKIKLMIVEDDLDWLRAMSVFLGKEPDMELTAHAISFEQAIQLAKIKELDMILMDINLGGNIHDGIFAAAEIKLFSSAKIIMLTSFEDSDFIKQAFTAGAANYLVKKNYGELPTLIRQTHKCVTPIEVIAEDYSLQKKNELLSVLSSAEKELFDYLQQGLKRTEIQSRLNKSESTVRNQINTVLKKLGVKNTKEAIRKISLKGLIRNK
ncbi:MAG: response regulator transcription factor [Clostridia bacterium]|nr:response regulator transcription factor [Clostridia bacterium]